MNRLLSHSGDIGDIIAHCTYLKTVGDVDLRLFPSPATGNRMDQKRVDMLRSFLLLQSYIKSVEWSPTPVGENLDGWRDNYKSGLNLSDMFHEWKGLPHWPAKEPWLVIDKPNRVAPVVFARSARYQNWKFSWRTAYDMYASKAVFLGTMAEYIDFTRRFGKVPYYQTKTYLDLARVVSAADLVVVNSTSIRWLAEGYKRSVIVEDAFPFNTHVKRPDAWYDHEGRLAFPPLDEVKRASQA